MTKERVGEEEENSRADAAGNVEGGGRQCAAY